MGTTHSQEEKLHDCGCKHVISQDNSQIWIASADECKQHLRKTTKGWHLCIQWKDGTTLWERLADVKESNPIEEAINKENGNTLWMDAVKKEMEDVRIAFKVIGEDEPLPGYQGIFTIKMEDFRRKARYIAGGHRTEAPATLTYASVVSRDTVRIALTLAALNGLEVKTSDIKIAYLTAPCAEKVWTRLGPEFGPEQGRRAIIIRSLYGLKLAGASFRNHLALCMCTLEWKPCLADPNLWMKPMMRADDNSEYYAYILLYVDDCLEISEDTTKELHALDHYFMMKKGSIRDPDMYLGAKLQLTKLPNGIVA